MSCAIKLRKPSRTASNRWNEDGNILQAPLKLSALETLKLHSRAVLIHFLTRHNEPRFVDSFKAYLPAHLLIGPAHGSLLPVHELRTRGIAIMDIFMEAGEFCNFFLSQLWQFLVARPDQHTRGCMGKNSLRVSWLVVCPHSYSSVLQLFHEQHAMQY